MARGYMPDGQLIVIAGWAGEFVPPATPLVEVALERAVEREVNGVGTRVSHSVSDGGEAASPH